MNRFWKQIGCGAVALLAAVSAHATYTITLSQVGNDVVMSGSGQIDTTGMNPTVLSSSCSSRFDPPGRTVCLGTGNYGLRAGGAITGGGVPTAMGTLQNFGSSSTGSPFVMSTNDIYLPAGYVSNSQLTNSVTFSNQTLTSLGATVGTYTLTLTSGDTIVVNVGQTVQSVPALGPVGLMALMLLLASGAYLAMKKRQI